MLQNTATYIIETSACKNLVLQLFLNPSYAQSFLKTIKKLHIANQQLEATDLYSLLFVLKQFPFAKTKQIF